MKLATVVLRDRFSTNQPLGWSCFRHLQDASRVARRGIQGHTSVLLAHVVCWAASYASCSLQVGAVSEGALHVRPFQFLGSISVSPTCVANLWKPCTCFFAQPASADAAGDDLSFLFCFLPPYDQHEPAAAVQQAQQ